MQSLHNQGSSVRKYETGAPLACASASATRRSAASSREMSEFTWTYPSPTSHSQRFDVCREVEVRRVLKGARSSAGETR